MHQNNPPSYNQSIPFNQARNCTASITEAKEKYIDKMSAKLDHLKLHQKHTDNLSIGFQTLKIFPLYHLFLLKTTNI